MDLLSDDTKRLVAFLRSKAHEGPAAADKAKRLLRVAASSGQEFPMIGRISVDTAGRAISLFEQENQVRVWITTCDVPWHQGPSAETPLLRILNPGQEVKELKSSREVADWVSIEPRGWVRICMLRLCSKQATPSGDVESVTVSLQVSEPVRDWSNQPAAAHERSSRGSLLGPARKEDAVKQWNRKRSNPWQDGLPECSKPRRGPAPTDFIPQAGIYVLDALNILKFRNDDTERPLELNWQQLSTAARYFKDQHKDVYAFLRHTREWSMNDAQVKELADHLGGKDFIVRCPSGACDDVFMITFARDREMSEKVGVRIVTNDLFRDHQKVVQADWIAAHTVKYAFAGGYFVPELKIST